MSLLGGAGALAVGLVLVAAGVGHLRDLRGLRAAMAAHRVLPSGVRGAVAVVLAPLEMVLGAGLVAGVALSHEVMGAAALAAALLTAGFTAYLLAALRRTRGAGDVPCGCGLGATPVGPWAVVRSALLTGLAVLPLVGGVPAWAGAGMPPAGASGAPLWAEVLLVVASGTALAVATAVLPAARAVPTTLTTLPGGAR